MATSMVEGQRDLILKRFIEQAVSEKKKEDNWKVIVCDKRTKSLLESVAAEDEVLGCSVTDIILLEDRREPQPDARVIYFLTPLPDIVEWLIADLRRGTYGDAWLLWTSGLSKKLAERVETAKLELPRIKMTTSLNIEVFPRETNLITFVQPYSFQILFNQHYHKLIKQHLEDLAQKILSICVVLDEYPLIRYYQPPEKNKEARALAFDLSKFVQDALDGHAKSNDQFPARSQRPRAVLLITDRSMDLMAPLVHELTYQAMAMDLLEFEKEPLLEDRAVYVKNNNPPPTGEEKKEKGESHELNERDKMWVAYRYLDMKDLLVKIDDDFRKFQAKNQQFANNSNQNISVNILKNMLAGLPEFQEGKAGFSLHIELADRCAERFRDEKLTDVVSLEQSLATGLDEDMREAKTVTDRLVRLLADISVTTDAKLRLLMLYTIYRGGIQVGDIEKLKLHAKLANKVKETVDNLQALGARTSRQLGDNVNEYEPLYKAKENEYKEGEAVSLSRFEPMLRYALEELCEGKLDNKKFPPRNPDLDDQGQQSNAAKTLRSAGKATWANTRPAANKARQRIIVFMAGGATYSEARVCHEVSRQKEKDILLTTTHMLTPKTFTEEAAQLRYPIHQLKSRIDGWLERPVWLNDSPPASSQNGGLPYGPRPTNEAMQNTNMGSSRPQNSSSRPGTSQTATPSHAPSSFSPEINRNSGKPKKDKKERHGILKLLGKH